MPPAMSESLSLDVLNGDRKVDAAATATTDAVAAPDGGFIAWLQCASSFSLFVSSWGLVNSFGVFQAYYEGTFPDVSSSNISWIGSIQGFLLISLGLVSGPFFDYGYLRPLVWTGSSMSVLGMMMTSLCTQYWQLVLSQGVLLGLGGGCLFLPALAVLPPYFKKRQALALGIGASGGAFGGIIFPIIFHELQPAIGFPWTTRVMAFIMLLFLLVPSLGMRVLFLPSEARRLFDKTAMTERPFQVSVAFLFTAFVAVYIPAFYIQVYGTENEIVGQELGFYLVPLLNTGSLFGRIIPPYFADRIGFFNVQIFCVVVAGVLAFTWTTIHGAASLVTFTVVYGFFAGAITTLCPNIAVALSPDIGVLGVRLGMLFIPIACGVLVGGPIAGALIARGWVYGQVFTGAVIFVAASLLIAVRIMLHGRKWRLKH